MFRWILFHSHLLLLIITLSHPTCDAATTRVENDYFGFSFSKQKNELHLFVAKFALVLDNCLVQVCGHRRSTKEIGSFCMQLHTHTLPSVENILQSALGCGESKCDDVTQVPPEYVVWVISLQVTYKQLHCFQNSNQVFHRGADFGN